MVVIDNEKKQMICSCPFYMMNNLACAHIFCLLNALQIKNIKFLTHLGVNWNDVVADNDPSTRDLAQRIKHQKKLLSFIDKVAEKTRQKRQKHKGGFVPAKKRKINVDFYPTSGSEASEPDEDQLQADGSKPALASNGQDGKRTMEIFDIHLPQGTHLKAFTR